jgi:hypothetical protein
MNVPTVLFVSLLKSSGLLSEESSSCKPFSKNMAKAKGNYLLSDAAIVYGFLNTGLFCIKKMLLCSGMFTFLKF